MVQLWKSDAQLASQRLPAIHFLVHNCCADINIQVTVLHFLLISILNTL